jgi:GNAT superfamily N-acetyltransferase
MQGEGGAEGLPALPELMEGGRVRLRNVPLGEVETLQDLCEASDYIAAWVGWTTPPDYAARTIQEGNLPPGGRMEAFRVKFIELATGGPPIGSLEFYQGFPAPDVLLVGWLFIHPLHQRKGLAEECVELLSHEAEAAGFSRMRLGVDLRNWPALRFWQRAGFDHVAGFLGEREFGPGASASIILERRIL